MTGIEHKVRVVHPRVIVPSPVGLPRIGVYPVEIDMPSCRCPFVHEALGIGLATSKAATLTNPGCPRLPRAPWRPQSKVSPLFLGLLFTKECRPGPLLARRLRFAEHDGWPEIRRWNHDLPQRDASLSE